MLWFWLVVVIVVAVSAVWWVRRRRRLVRWAAGDYRAELTAETRGRAGYHYNLGAQQPGEGGPTSAGAP